MNTKQPPEKDISFINATGKHILTSLKVGCLTFFVAGLALMGGLWLDIRLETFPRWTLILVLGSAPFTVIGVFWMVKRSLNKLGEESDISE